MFQPMLLRLRARRQRTRLATGINGGTLDERDVQEITTKRVTNQFSEKPSSSSSRNSSKEEVIGDDDNVQEGNQERGPFSRHDGRAIEDRYEVQLPRVVFGRDDQLQQLERLAYGGKEDGVVCLLTGIKGAGKTALLQEFCRRNDELSTLTKDDPLTSSMRSYGSQPRQESEIVRKSASARVDATSIGRQSSTSCWIMYGTCHDGSEQQHAFTVVDEAILTLTSKLLKHDDDELVGELLDGIERDVLDQLTEPMISLLLDAFPLSLCDLLPTVWSVQSRVENLGARKEVLKIAVQRFFGILCNQYEKFLKQRRQSAGVHERLALDRLDAKEAQETENEAEGKVVLIVENVENGSRDLIDLLEHLCFHRNHISSTGKLMILLSTTTRRRNEFQDSRRNDENMRYYTTSNRMSITDRIDLPNTLSIMILNQIVASSLSSSSRTMMPHKQCSLQDDTMPLTEMLVANSAGGTVMQVLQLLRLIYDLGHLSAWMTKQYESNAPQDGSVCAPSLTVTSGCQEVQEHSNQAYPSSLPSSKEAIRHVHLDLEAILADRMDAPAFSDEHRGLLAIAACFSATSHRISRDAVLHLYREMNEISSNEQEDPCSFAETLPNFGVLEQAGYLVRCRQQSDEDDLYEFTNDSIRRAALSLLAEAQDKYSIHLRLGIYLKERGITMCFDRGSENFHVYKSHALFQFTDQLNLGRTVATRDWIEVSRLNMECARRCIAQGAYDNASSFLHHGLEWCKQGSIVRQRRGTELTECLTEDAQSGVLATEESSHWEDPFYELALELYSYRAGVLLQLQQFEECERVEDEVLRHTRRPLDTIVIRQVRMSRYMATIQYSEAIDFGLASLVDLFAPTEETSSSNKRSIHLPRKPNKLALVITHNKLKALLNERSNPEDLVSFPTAAVRGSCCHLDQPQEPRGFRGTRASSFGVDGSATALDEVKLQMHLQISQAAEHVGERSLKLLSAWRAFLLCHSAGPARQMARCVADYAGQLTTTPLFSNKSISRNIELCYRLAQVAAELMQRYNASPSSVCPEAFLMIHNYCVHLRTPMTRGVHLEATHKVYTKAFANGQRDSACECQMTYWLMVFSLGLPLSTLEGANRFQECGRTSCRFCPCSQIMLRAFRILHGKRGGYHHRVDVAEKQSLLMVLRQQKNQFGLFLDSLMDMYLNYMITTRPHQHDNRYMINEISLVTSSRALWEQPFVKTLEGTTHFLVVPYAFYSALAALTLAAGADTDADKDKQYYWKVADKYTKILITWESNGVPNVSHKVLFLTAEQRRMRKVREITGKRRVDRVYNGVMAAFQKSIEVAETVAREADDQVGDCHHFILERALMYDHCWRVACRPDDKDDESSWLMKRRFYNQAATLYRQSEAHAKASDFCFSVRNASENLSSTSKSSLRKASYPMAFHELVTPSTDLTVDEGMSISLRSLANSSRFESQNFAS